jgi:sigma54-dependent transcription regulator
MAAADRWRHSGVHGRHCNGQGRRPGRGSQRTRQFRPSIAFFRRYDLVVLELKPELVNDPCSNLGLQTDMTEVIKTIS